MTTHAGVEERDAQLLGLRSINAHVFCSPDETLRLQEVSRYEAQALDRDDDAVSEGEGEVRRVVPPRLDRLPLYVQHQGATVKVQKSEVVVVGRDGKEHARVGFGHLGQLNLYGQVHLTGAVIQGCLDRSVPVCFFSSGGWYRGRTQASANRQVHVRMAQYAALSSEGSLRVARTLVADKIANQRVLLRRNRAGEDEIPKAALWELKRLRDQAARAESMATLLGTEGAAAKLYWGYYSELVARDEPAFAMQGRSRRPPRDRTNALLSYLYGMLTKDVALAVEGVGLDPHLGLYHTPHHGRPSMALDLMEPFRPLVADSVVLQMIRRGEVQPGNFVEAGQEVSLKPGARRSLIQAYERRMDESITHPTFGYTITYRQTLWVQARLLTRVLLGELPEVPSFRTR